MTNLSLATLTAIANSAAALLSLPPVKAFPSKPAAIARIEKHLAALAAAGTPHELKDDQLVAIVAEVIEIAAERKRRRSPISTSRATFRDDQYIRLLVRDNPKRKNTPAHARYSFYRDAITVRQYAAQVGRRAALIDLVYDVSRGYVAIETVLDERMVEEVKAA